MCLPEFRWGDQLGGRIRPRDRAWSLGRSPAAGSCMGPSNGLAESIVSADPRQVAASTRSVNMRYPENDPSTAYRRFPRCPTARSRLRL